MEVSVIGGRWAVSRRCPGDPTSLTTRAARYYHSSMKEHISITIDEKTIRRLRRYAAQERRAVSSVIELAVESYLGERVSEGGGIVTTPGRFQGTFSREDTYAGR